MLEDLYHGALADAAIRQETQDFAAVEKAALGSSPALNVAEVLRPDAKVKILAEVKRASPSRGDLAQIANPAELARIYADNGASAISVLTEERKFKGSLKDLAAVRAAVDIPILRKDFIANEYQLLEARAAGADIALLIVAGLESKLLRRLFDFTSQLGMMPFVETHSADELRIAADLGGRMIGVNARDLSSFETDRNLFEKLVDLFPAGAIKVAESAVRTAEDVLHYRQAGADVVLVGEALVKGNPAEMLLSFLA
ncbi:MAG: indole-3-glycerol phosphate synthase TrpC [Rhodoluna sp.]